MEVDGRSPDTEPLAIDILLVGLASVRAYRSCSSREAGRLGVDIAGWAEAVVDISSKSAARRLLLSARCRSTGEDGVSPASDVPKRDRAVPRFSRARTGEGIDSVAYRACA